jgi:hypothetical protein
MKFSPGVWSRVTRVTQRDQGDDSSSESETTAGDTPLEAVAEEGHLRVRLSATSAEAVSVSEVTGRERSRRRESYGRNRTVRTLHHVGLPRLVAPGVPGARSGAPGPRESGFRSATSGEKGGA